MYYNKDGDDDRDGARRLSKVQAEEQLVGISQEVVSSESFSAKAEAEDGRKKAAVHFKLDSDAGYGEPAHYHDKIRRLEEENARLVYELRQIKGFKEVDDV